MLQKTPKNLSFALIVLSTLAFHAHAEESQYPVVLIVDEGRFIYKDGYYEYVSTSDKHLAVDSAKKVNAPGEKGCSGLIAPDTLIRDNYYQLLRCHNESETNIQAIY